MTRAAKLTSRGEVEAIELSLPTDRYPDLMHVLSYWEEKRGQRFAPARRDIDPADLIEVLPRIMLADVIGDPPEFRYRLSGTGIRDIHGKEMTAKRPRDLAPPSYAALIHSQYCDCVARRQPMLHIITLDTIERSRCYVRLLMPLSEDGKTVTMLMAVDGKEQDSQALRNFFRQCSGK